MKKKLKFAWETIYFFCICVPLAAVLYATICAYYFFKPKKSK